MEGVLTVTGTSDLLKKMCSLCVLDSDRLGNNAVSLTPTKNGF